MAQRFFTLDEANALIPFLSEKLSLLKSLKSEIAALAERCRETGMEAPQFLAAEKLAPEMEEIRSTMKSRADEADAVLQEILERGPVVKDLEKGLVDFFCELGEKTVFLCWKAGEPEVRYWHGLDEGFAGRKSLFERRYLEQVTKIH